MASCPPPDLRLSISHDRPDSVLTKTLDVIVPPHDEFRISKATGSEGVDGVVKGVLRRSPGTGFVMLDLIGHASSDGILQLGDWAVQDGQAVATALDKVPGLKLCGIRLLGCNTAATETGRDAIRTMAAQFRTCVWGTNGPIGAGHFDADGFADSTILLSDEDLPPPAPAPPQPLSTAAISLRRKRWFLRFPPVTDLTLDGAVGTLRLETLAEATTDRTLARPDLRWPVREVGASDFKLLFDCVEPSLASAPGLLALPERELVSQVPAIGAPRFRRATMLLGGAFLRVYPRGRDHGVVVRIDPAHDDAVRAIIARSTDALIPRRRVTVPPRPRIVRR